MKTSVCRLCRREQSKLFLKGDRCQTAKCSFIKRSYGPGDAGQKRQSKPSEYSRQLRAKQKAKRIYNMSEKQFKNNYSLASKSLGKTGERLLQLLETRLDNVIYKLGYGSSIKQAKQIISHKKVSVNDKIMNISSYTVKTSDVIKLVKTERINKKAIIPNWIKFENKNGTATILNHPKRDEIQNDIEEQLIVEFYSR